VSVTGSRRNRRMRQGKTFGWAERMNLAVRNVARSVDAPNASLSPARALTAEQVVAFLSAADGGRFYPFFALAIGTGMRRGEIGALTWEDVDLDGGTVVVRQAIGQDRSGHSFIKRTKTGRERVVPLNALAISALKTQRASQAAQKLLKRKEYEDQGLVFADELGRLLDMDAISKTFAALARELGIKRKGISLHSCRHFGATQARGRQRRPDRGRPSRARLGLDRAERLRHRGRSGAGRHPDRPRDRRRAGTQRGG
jgi:integrase